MSKQKRDLPEINFIAASLRTTTGEAHHDLIDVTIATKNNFRKKGLFFQQRKCPILLTENWKPERKRGKSWQH